MTISQESKQPVVPNIGKECGLRLTMSGIYTSAKSKINAAHRGTLGIILILLVANLVGNYMYADEFGIYEDDYFFTVQAYGWELRDCWNEVSRALLHWPQGRPVGFALTAALSWVSAQADSLLAAYFLGFVLLSINGLLVFVLVRHYLPTTSAVLAAAFYMLYPCDTSKVILMHRVFQLFNFSLLVIAVLSYIRGKYWVSYAAAGTCLLIYESFFFPFLLAAALPMSGDKWTWRSLFSHLGICVALLVLVAGVRLLIGDDRVSETMSSPAAIFAKSATASLIGPLTCASESLRRLFEVIVYASPMEWIVIATFAGLVVGLVRPDTRALRDAFPANVIEVKKILWLTVAGLAMMSAGYLLAFRPDNYPPVVTIGRLSGFNAPGSLGAVLAFAAISSTLLTVIGSLARRVVLGTFVGVLVVFGLQVQKVEYVENWRQQKAFWLPILETSGEWRRDTAVVVDIEGHAGTIQTAGFPAFWVVNSAPILAPLVLQYPPAWSKQVAADPSDDVPRVFGFANGIKTTLLDNERILLHTPPWTGGPLWPTIRNESFIRFTYADGSLTRSNGNWTLHDVELRPMQAANPELAMLPQKRLFGILFGPRPTWPAFTRAKCYPQ